MEDLNILFLTRKGEGCVGAPQTFYEFEQAVGRIANCKWAGKDWSLHRPGEDMRGTVERVMPDADWVIVDRDDTWATPKNRWFKVGMFLSDLHGKHSMRIGSPEEFMRLINGAGFDAVFMKYLEIHGFREVNPLLFMKSLKGRIHFLPWSVDVSKHRWGEKTVDAAFMGSHQPRVYPLRDAMWNGMPHVCGRHSFIRVSTPTTGGTYERKVDKLMEKHYVGDKYVDALNHSKILLFGSSIYRYPVQKYFEGSASGCLLLCDEPSNAKELGFVDGETYIKVNLHNWGDKLKYCLENYDEVKHVAENGMRNTVEKHSHEKRAQEFLGMLR